MTFDYTWKEAIEDAKRELGYSEDEYISDWDEVKERAELIREYEYDEYKKQQSYENEYEYQQFLKSDIWKEIRSKVFERDNYTCRKCGGIANEVHHLTYERHLTDQEHDDCISVCSECHRKIHNIHNSPIAKPLEPKKDWFGNKNFDWDNIFINFPEDKVIVFTSKTKEIVKEVLTIEDFKKKYIK